MRIVHIVKGDMGGLDNISKEIFNYLKSNGLEQKIFYFLDFGNKFYKGFKKEKLKPFNFNEEIIFINLFNHRKDFKEANIIHVHHTKTWLLFSPLLFYKNKLVHTFHGNFGTEIKKSIIENILIKAIINYCTLFSRKLIFLNKAQKENIKKHSFFKEILERKSVIINNFINETLILRKKKNINSNVVFVGRYTKLKGFDDLIKVAKSTPEVNFYLIGNKSYKPRLPNLKNIGQIDNSKIFKEYDKHSILILPSYTESWGLVILEAMARGLTILASNLPTIRDYFIDTRNGYLFHAGDLKEIKRLIIYLKNNPDKVKRISKNNLKDVWKFTADKQLPKYLKVYKEVSNEK